MSAYDIFIFLIGEALIVIMAGVIPVFWIRGNKQLAVQVAVSLFLAVVIIEILKHLFPAERPYIVHELNPIPGIIVRTDDSFPSGHAGAAFAIASVVWDRHHRLGGILLAMALLVAVGRVLLWVHFPLDVIVGASIGIAVGYFVNRFLFKVQD